MSFKFEKIFVSAFEKDVNKFLASIDAPEQGSIPISNRAELEAIKNNLNGKYHMIKDIDLNGEEWEPINSFTGTFDGQGHVIHNLTITGDREYSGLFDRITNTAVVIKNVGLEGTDININRDSGNVYVGGICGTNSASIYNCYNAGKVFASAPSSTTTSSNYAYAGGVCGNFSNGAISDCYNTGEIYASAFYARAGGICGQNSNTTISIENCYNNGNVSISAIFSSGKYVGGVCGINAGGIADIIGHADARRS